MPTINVPVPSETVPVPASTVTVPASTVVYDADAAAAQLTALGYTVTPPSVTPPPPPPPPPPPTTGKLWIGPSWPRSSAAAQATISAFGLTESEAFIVNNNSSIFPWTGSRMFAEGRFNTGTTASWTSNANSCIAAGVRNIRLSWEFNTAFPADNSGWWPNNPAGFLNIWKNCYTAYSNAAVAKGLPGGWFSFCWNPDKGGYPARGNTTTTLKFYPNSANLGAPPNGSRTWLGDVGCVGIDLYIGNIPSGVTGAALFNGYNANLGWHPAAVAALATQNGHDIAAPEWSNRPDWNNGVTDDGPYMTATVDWAANFVESTGRNAYLGAWVWNYGTNTPWNFLAGANSVAAVKAAVAKYRAAGVVPA